MALTREHILRLFDDIEENDHHYRVRFYETNSTLIFSLDEAEQFYFSFQYINSLFELGKYDHVLAEIDALIEYVFANDVSFGYEDSYESLLLKKAAALHNTFRFRQSLEISEQLIGINPYQPVYQSLAKRSIRAMYQWNTSSMRLMTIIVVIATACGSAIFWFTNGQVPSGSLLATFMLIISPCLLTLSILGIVYLYGITKSNEMIRQLVRSKKEKRKALKRKF